jgi:hypothetical protein
VVNIGQAFEGAITTKPAITGFLVLRDGDADDEAGDAFSLSRLEQGGFMAA